MKVASIMEELIVQATSDKGDRPSGNSLIRFGTVNAGTISGGRNKVTWMFTRQKVDLCCLQATRWREGSSSLVKGKDSIYKFFCSRDQLMCWDAG